MEIDNIYGSDHFLINLEVQSNENSTQFKNITRWNLKEANSEKFTTIIEISFISMILDISRRKRSKLLL